MIRLALPKGRNLDTALAAFKDAGVGTLDGFDRDGRKLRQRIGDGVEAIQLKDWDLALYVAYGVADCGVVGSDVLEELDLDLLVPARFTAGTSRLSLVGHAGSLPPAGAHVRLATKYPRTAQRMLAGANWGAEVLKLSGSIELAPLLDLADLALDIVQTGRTLRENNLVELQRVRDVAPCLVVNRASYQRLRADINALIDRFAAVDAVR